MTSLNTKVNVSFDVTTKEAPALFAHHIKMAVLFFEASPEGSEGPAEKKGTMAHELHQAFSGFPELQKASSEFLERVTSVYANL
jgi:hypothetical protein